MTQLQYVGILFDDCGFTRSQARDFLALRYRGRKYADELTVYELSALIGDLKERKVSPVSVCCEACGAEFSSQAKLDQHERECIG